MQKQFTIAAASLAITLGFSTGVLFADAPATQPAKTDTAEPECGCCEAPQDKAAQTQPAQTPSQEKHTVPPALNFTVKNIEGKPVNLADYQGKVVLMVNVASKCGLTPQYKGLEGLNEKFGAKGLKVLGFPANNFGAQEPGSEAEIKTFCTTNYGVKFDMFSKISVKGEDKHPLYKYLTEQDAIGKKGGDITWNFEKFLLNRKGEVVARFSPKTAPDAPEVVKAIETELAKN
ncbi:MAG: glutathione peroxidase [Planctomycetes bacterium]|nr:glutathione peroxidase [Planctomycetota bacterium]